MREAAGTLTGHAAGQDTTPMLAGADIARALGTSEPGPQRVEPDTLPEPLVLVVDCLGDDLSERKFVPSAELVGALDVEPTAFGRLMSEWR